MKICIGCNEELDESNFYRKGGKNKDKGHQSRCKKCFNDKTKAYQNKNYKKIQENQKIYYLINKEKINNSNKINYKLNKEERSKKAKEKYKSNPRYFLDKTKAYQNKLKLDPIQFEKSKEKRRKYDAKRRKKYPYLYILRNQIKNIKELLGTHKQTSLKKELGYSPLEFKKHIEYQFKENMNWDNLGLGKEKWNIDHKIPVTWFVKETPFNIVNNLQNLHPMWWEENNLKSNKYSSEIDCEYYNLIKEYIIEDKLININIYNHEKI